MEHSTHQFEKTTGTLDYVLARNDFIDAFAELEASICQILHSCGHTTSNEPFGNRLKAFRSAEKTNLIAKANFGKRDQIADHLASIMPLRADIVHSKLRVAKLDDEDVAIFTNAQNAHMDNPHVRIITLAQLRGYARDLRDQCKRIETLRTTTNPPPLPLPPSPGAAGGP